MTLEKMQIPLFSDSDNGRKKGERGRARRLGGRNENCFNWKVFIKLGDNIAGERREGLCIFINDASRLSRLLVWLAGRLLSENGEGDEVVKIMTAVDEGII